MLMKLTTGLNFTQKLVQSAGLNFINVLHTAFYTRRAQKHKKDRQVFSLFMLLGSTSIKADRKYVGEIEPRCTSVCKNGSEILPSIFKFQLFQQYFILYYISMSSVVIKVSKIIFLKLLWHLNNW